MNIEHIKQIIRKKHGMLSDKQLARLEEMWKNGDNNDDEYFDIKEYASKCAMGLHETDDRQHMSEQENEPDTDDTNEESSSGPIALLEKAISMLKSKYDG